MTKSRPLDEQLAAISALRSDPTSAGAIEKLREAITRATSLVAARAALIAGEAEITVLVPELMGAFDRFMDEPTRTDKGCGAKSAIADALYRIGAPAEAVFLRGIRHVQMEPVYGGKADTAIDLRGSCALGLARMGYPDVTLELADLLADKEAPCRISAARAMGYSERPDAIPVLRFKALSGDAEPAVVGECLASLLKLAPGPSLAFVARYLDSKDDAIAEAAAIALGGSRRAEALDLLKTWRGKTVDPALRKTAYLAIAMLRTDGAMAYLIEEITEGNAQAASDAIAALGMYHYDASLRQRVEAAAGKRRDGDLRDAISEAFERG